MPFVCAGSPYAQTPSCNLKYENNRSDPLLVFQAPGQDEWNGCSPTLSGERIPIDSASSRSCAERMRQSFSRNHVSRTDYDVAEAVCCFPGKLSNGREKRPRVGSIRRCANNMMN